MVDTNSSPKLPSPPPALPLPSGSPSSHYTYRLRSCSVRSNSPSIASDFLTAQDLGTPWPSSSQALKPTHLSLLPHRGILLTHCDLRHNLAASTPNSNVLRTPLQHFINFSYLCIYNNNKPNPILDDFPEVPLILTSTKNSFMCEITAPLQDSASTFKQGWILHVKLGAKTVSHQPT